MARSRFDWAAVEPGLIRQLLRTAYLTQTDPDSESADATRVLDEKRLAAAATPRSLRPETMRRQLPRLALQATRRDGQTRCADTRRRAP
jgi:hypothetical protein